MSDAELNAFLGLVGGDPLLQTNLRESDAAGASALARGAGFNVTVGDLIRYKSRSTSWRLSDEELAEVHRWQPKDQPYWWQHIWQG